MARTPLSWLSGGDGVMRVPRVRVSRDGGEVAVQWPEGGEEWVLVAVDDGGAVVVGREVDVADWVVLVPELVEVEGRRVTGWPVPERDDDYTPEGINRDAAGGGG